MYNLFIYLFVSFDGNKNCKKKKVLKKIVKKKM